MNANAPTPWKHAALAAFDAKDRLAFHCGLSIRSDIPPEVSEQIAADITAAVNAHDELVAIAREAAEHYNLIRHPGDSAAQRARRHRVAALLARLDV